MTRLSTQGIRAALMLTTLVAASVLAYGEPISSGGVTRLNETASERRARLIEENLRRRADFLKRYKEKGLRVYTDENGNPAFTNIPERYENKPGFEEFNLNLHQVKRPSWYQAAQEVSTQPPTLRKLVSHYTRLYNLDASLVYAVIKCESDFNPKAVSPVGASGYMQLMPGTAKDMGVGDIFDPAENIAGGTQYLAKMLELFDGDENLALAGYNAGPGAVKKYGGIPPYEETKQYVKLVQDYKKYYTKYGVGRLLNARVTPDLQIAKAEKPKEAYTVTLRSGLEMPVEWVKEKGDYWLLRLRGRTWQIRKDLVVKITES